MMMQAIGGGSVVPAKVSLLPVKRSNNVGVFLRKLKLGPQQVLLSAAAAAGLCCPGWSASPRALLPFRAPVCPLSNPD